MLSRYRRVRSGIIPLLSRQSSQISQRAGDAPAVTEFPKDCQALFVQCIARPRSHPDRERHLPGSSVTRRRLSGLPVPRKMERHSAYSERARRMSPCNLTTFARLLRERATAFWSPNSRHKPRLSSNRERAPRLSRRGRERGPPERSERPRRPACLPTGARCPGFPRMSPSADGVISLLAGKHACRKKRASSRLCRSCRPGRASATCPAGPCPSARYSRISQKRNSAVPSRKPHSASPVSVSHSRAARKLSCSSAKRSSHSVPLSAALLRSRFFRQHQAVGGMGAFRRGRLSACLQFFQSILANRFQHHEPRFTLRLLDLLRPGSCPPSMPCRRADPDRDRLWCRTRLPRLPECIRRRIPTVSGRASAPPRSTDRGSSPWQRAASVAVPACRARRRSKAATGWSAE